MKSLKNKNKNKIKSCKCGGDEFATQPNQYDIYKIINDKLEKIETTSTYDEDEYYCVDCGEELIGAEDFVNA